jgi:hypothetical protein
MITRGFRRLPPAIAACLVMALIATSIPAVAHAEGGGEGRDSHDRADRSKDTGTEKKNPKQPDDLFGLKRF